MSARASLLVFGMIIILAVGFALLQSGGRDDFPDSEKQGAKSGNSNGSFETHYTEDEEAVFEVLVVLRDQEGAEAEALKRGDVLAVRKAPQEWSRTEETSYLIVPLRTIGKEAYSLLEPRKDGETIVRARHRYIDLSAIGFTGEHVLSGQPLRGKVFGMEIVKER